MSMIAADAAKAYTQALKAPDAGVAAPAAPAAGPSFADMVEDSVAGATEALQAGEEAAVAGANGQTEVLDVVTAVSAAEVTLETVVAVRDKVVEAYQQIMRMPI